ncbi:hypothetical protein H6F43_06415 [Leptolyngbya sp. FACHB-36]|uniref:hypothetical protein n=1 Tax=Leptolyngbya sp. FACHB-36 TaxID=2692808 RepID=UPI0016808477|nr:hypothetical protein [Leptolyngbya sp. FACHB-36]MBD2019821.1 hypothetical protein [Leptolyngbya sp. FACHB-36]
MEKRRKQPRPSVREASPQENHLLPAGKTQQLTAQALVQVLEKRPMIFWGGLWSSLLMVAVVSVSSLLSPNFSKGRSASGSALGSHTATVTRPATRDTHLPLWMFGAIALSCTAGSILISKQLARPHQSRLMNRTHQKSRSRPKSPRMDRSRQRSKPYSPATSPFTAAQPLVPVRYPAPTQTPVTMRSNRSQAVRSQAMTLRAMQPAPRSITKSKLAQPAPVTVVPAGENHPLDWGKANLTDSLDLRKRRSLSSWLGN